MVDPNSSFCGESTYGRVRHHAPIAQIQQTLRIEEADRHRFDRLLATNQRQHKCNECSRMSDSDRNTQVVTPQIKKGDSTLPGLHLLAR